MKGKQEDSEIFTIGKDKSISRFLSPDSCRAISEENSNLVTKFSFSSILPYLCDGITYSVILGTSFEL